MDGSEYDAIVVGAGPGGSAAAISLAQAGWRVLLLDKATFPRDKVCGDMVSPRSQRVLRELGCLQAVERLCSNRVASGVFYLDGEQFMAAQVPRIEGLTNYGYVIPRLVFDEIIFRQAQAVGVETIERCEVKDVVVDTSGVTLLAQREGKSCSFRGRLVIGADGARSVVAPALRMAATDSKNVTIALRAYYEGVEGDPSQVAIFFDRSYFPGYAWVFPLGGGHANVGLGVVMDVYQRYRINLRERLEHWIQNDPVARAYLGAAHLEGRIIGWPLNTYRSKSRNYADRVLLIGDAASLVDPINGEGIHTALESARIAARVADEALRSDDLSASSLSRYEQRWRAEFDLDLRVADLFVTIAGNRSLIGLWLSALRMVGDAACRDRRYAETIVGILAGVVPARESLTLDFMMKTLLHSPRFYGRMLNLPSREGLPGVADWGVVTGKAVLYVLREMAQQPRQTAEWGRDVLSKSLGVLAALRARDNHIKVQR